MKLYLCGGGSGKQIIGALSRFSKELDRTKPILYIPLALEKESYDGCYEWFSEEIKNIRVEKFDMIRSSLELSKKDFNNYCAIFIGGGNTFKLLDEIKQYGNYEKILDYLKKDGVVFGGSSGAIIFGNNINSCLLDDKNNIGLKDTYGFNLLKDYSILCHLKRKNLKKNCKYLEEYSKENRVIYLPEENVIIIEDSKISMIGNKRYMIFDNGKYVWHHFANVKRDFN